MRARSLLLLVILFLAHSKLLNMLWPFNKHLWKEGRKKRGREGGKKEEREEGGREEGGREGRQEGGKEEGKREGASISSPTAD